MTEKMQQWRKTNPRDAKDQNRELARRKQERLASDPDFHAAYRDAENARRRSKTNRGREFTTSCTRCGEDFTYTYIQKPKTVCPLCRAHDGDWKNFRLTGAEAEALRARGRCDICGTTRPGGRFGEWHIDHCHEHGHVRGLLCAACNTVLGLMGDDPERLRAAADYLQEGE